MRLGEAAAGHRHRQLDVVRRIGRHEVHGRVREGAQELARVADAKLGTARVERPTTARIGGAQVDELGTAAVPLGAQHVDDLAVHGGPAWIQLEADRPSWAAGDGRTEQRPADTRERVQDELTGP